jgi:Fur family ferric uptake transcriptional regulator
MTPAVRPSMRCILSLYFNPKSPPRKVAIKVKEMNINCIVLVYGTRKNKSSKCNEVAFTYKNAIIYDMNTASPHSLLIRSGLKKTESRVALLNLFINAKKPLSAKKITENLIKKGIDRVTVYRMLEILSKKGIIRKVYTSTSEVQYEIVDLREDHHHIICLECKKISDFHGCNAEILVKKALEQVKDFKSVSYHSFDLFGVCANCIKK